MRSRYLLAVAFAWLGLAVPVASGQSEGGTLFVREVERGEALMAEGRHREAIRALQKAAKLAPEPSFRVALALSICFNRLGEFGRSEKHARAAIAAAQEPGDGANAHYLLGLSLAGTKPAEAEAAFRRVLELTNGALNLARLRLGEVLASLGRRAEACAALAQFLEVQPAGGNAAVARTAMLRLECEPASDGASNTAIWTEVRTDRLRVAGNGAEARLVEIATRAESLLATLAMLAPGTDLLGGGSISLYAFADEAGFAPYRLEGGDAGLFVPHPHGVYAAFGIDEPSVRLIYRQLVLHSLAVHFPGLPAWFRVGAAEVYSNLRSDGGSVRLGLPIEGHLWLLRASAGTPPIARVLESSASEAAGMEEFNAWSWALFHYLAFGGSDPAGRIEDYLRLVAELERPRRAFQRAFRLSPEELAERVLAHARADPMPYLRITSAELSGPARSARPLSESEVDLALADLAVHARPETVAPLLEELRELASREPANAAAWATLGEAEAEAEAGDRQAAIAALGKAVELDPGAFKARLLLGGELLERAPESAGAAAAAAYDEAVAALEQAAALRPDSFPVWERLSYAHAGRAEASDRAVEVTARALALRPGRTDLAYNLLLVRAKRREVEEVRALLRRLEALGASSSRVASARELLLQLTLREARELMQGDRLDDAVALLAEIDARTTSDSLRSTARDWMRRITSVQQHNMFVERYNRAVVAYDADEWDLALEILTELAALARPGMQARLVESLRQEVDYWRD